MDGSAVANESLLKQKVAPESRKGKAVTAFLSTIWPFDARATCEANWKKWSNPWHPSYPKYGNKSKEQILEMWETSKEEGLAKHQRIQQLIQDVLHGKVARDSDDKVSSGVVSFLEQYGKDIAFAQCEVQLSDASLRLRGKADFLAQDQAGRFSIIDWKTSDTKDFDPRTNFRGSQSLGPPLDLEGQLPHNDFYKHALQLNLYKAMLESNYECHGRDVQVDQLLIALLRSDGSVQVTEVPALPELVRRALEHLCTDLEASSSSSTASSSWPRRSSSSSSWTRNGNITLQSFRAASLRPHPITVERSEVTHTCHDGPDSREVRVVTLKVTDKANLNQSGVDLGPQAAAVTASGVATLGGPKGGEEAKSATVTATAEDTSHSLRAVTFPQPQKGQLPLAPPQTAAAKGKPFQTVTVTTPRRSQTCADPPPPPSPPPAPPPPSPPRRRPRGSSFTSDLNLRPTKLALHSPE